MRRQPANIVITGFSGTGKTWVASEVARRLNWSFIDTDEEVVRLAGKRISDVFRQEGESRFRVLEREVIEKACQQEQAVIAIGGGAIVDPRNYEALAKNGLIFCLEARPETIHQRLFEDAAYDSEPEVRPLLNVDNPLERIRKLKASRQVYYANADWTVHTDSLSIDQVVEEVIRGWMMLRFRVNNMDDRYLACQVTTATQSYPVFVGYGLMDMLGEKIGEFGLSGAINIISDENVFSIYGSRVKKVLRNSGFKVNSLVVPPGEATKCMDWVSKIYDFLVKNRVERNDILVAFGGGMVGDLAGYVAATFLRGIPWIQVPTSLMAMVDASIGGKVAVNHPLGKNLIGAFYQPVFVLADCQALGTLPERELTSGWAEVIKYGLIKDKDYFKFLEDNVNKLVKLEPDAISKTIAHSAAIKAQIVSQDEKERGLRTILNYGHTIAHGLEAATQYRCFLHGEAVAIGMVGAAKLSQKLGLLTEQVVERQKSLLQEFGLPVKIPCELLDTFRSERGGGTYSTEDEFREAISSVTRAMELDKKAKAKKIRWVLLEDIGRVTISSDISRQDILDILRELL